MEDSTASPSSSAKLCSPLRTDSGVGAGNGHGEEEDTRFNYASILAVGRGGNSKATRFVPRRSQKTETALPEASDAATKLAEALEACYRVLQEKPLYPRTVAEGVHEPAQKLVEVNVSRGPLLHSMGYRQRSKLMLWPEEALFLLERGSLVVRKLEVLEQQTSYPDYSIQEGYARLLGSGQGEFSVFQVIPSREFLQRLAVPG